MYRFLSWHRVQTLFFYIAIVFIAETQMRNIIENYSWFLSVNLQLYKTQISQFSIVWIVALLKKKIVTQFNN